MQTQQKRLRGIGSTGGTASERSPSETVYRDSCRRKESLHPPVLLRNNEASANTKTGASPGDSSYFSIGWTYHGRFNTPCQLPLYFVMLTLPASFRESREEK